MIYIECNPDKVLISSLDISKKEIIHAFSKGNICNKMEKNKYSRGLVDEDPLSAQPSYILRLKLISDEDEIKLLHDEWNQNYLIMLHPTLEGWILKATKEVKLDISNYGLPDSEGELHKIINVRLKNFKNLIKDIRQESKKLKTLEKYLRS